LSGTADTRCVGAKELLQSPPAPNAPIGKRKEAMRATAIALFVIAATSGIIGTLRPSLAQGGAATRQWKGCQSSDADTRITACTAFINANGYGSRARLAQALDSRCWAYSTKTQFDLAIADCKRSISLTPKYFYAYNNLGTAYLGKTDYQAAIAEFNRAID